MAQLYLTSSFLQGERFLSLEQLFKEVDPEKVILVFDANIVIYFRDFYLDSHHFIKNWGQNDIYCILRCLVEQIHRYNLAINATIGVEESSRNKQDFSLNEEKRMQTHLAVMSMFKMDIDMLNDYILKKKVVKPVKDNTCGSASKIKALTQESIFQHSLIVAYAAILKIFILYRQFEQQEISPREAYLQLYTFLTQEIDVMAGMPLLFAFHLFGGANDVGKIILAKKNDDKESKIHKLFNGAIDLIYPHLINKAQSMHPEFYKNYKHIPVLVTLDEKIAKLHACYKTSIIFDSTDRTDNEINYNPEIIRIEFPPNLSWSNEDRDYFINLYRQDTQKRLLRALSGPRNTLHLLPIVEKYERLVFNML